MGLPIESVSAILTPPQKNNGHFNGNEAQLEVSLAHATRAVDYAIIDALQDRNFAEAIRLVKTASIRFMDRLLYRDLFFFFEESALLGSVPNTEYLRSRSATARSESTLATRWA